MALGDIEEAVKMYREGLKYCNGPIECLTSNIGYAAATEMFKTMAELDGTRT